MSMLRLRVHKYLDSYDEAPPQVFARIHALDPDTGRNVLRAEIRREMIPISDQSTAGRLIDLPPGRYFVEVTLPSGEILGDDVRVPATGDAELVLQAEESPHEWLSWQHLMGNVGLSPAERGSTARKPKATARRKARRVKRSKGAQSVERSLATSGGEEASRASTRGPQFRHLRASWKSPIAEQVVVGEPIHWLSHPIPGLAGDVQTIDGWHSITALQGDPAQLIKSLNGEMDAHAIVPHARDEYRAVYRLTSGMEGLSGAMPPITPLRRSFVAVRRLLSVELVSLPIPWRRPWSSHDAIVEVIVQQLARYDDFAASIAVRDERLGMLLGFLSSGALPAAKRITETSQDMLFSKTENALAAAAGAYALVGTESDTSPKSWHEWVHNLMRYYPHVPDGAIQWATLKLRMKRSGQEIDQAREALKVAFRRGIPYYSIGVRWLLDGLERISHNDPEAANMCEAVRSLAWRIHPQSPFTIVRLGGD